MKKIIILLIAVALLLITPYFVGSKVESEFKNAIEQINKNPSFSLAIAEYHKGWFQSDAVLDISFNNVPELQDKEPIKILPTIYHGPLFWKTRGVGFGLAESNINFELPVSLQKEIDEIESIKKDTITITSRTSFGLSTNILLDVKPFSANLDDGEISVKPAMGDMTYDKDGHMTGEMEWQGLTITNHNSTVFDISSMTADWDQQLISGDMFSANAIFDGTLNFNLKNINVTGQVPSESMELNDLSLNAVSETSDKTTDIKIVMSAKKLNASNQSFKDFSYDFSIDNLDTEVMQKINQVVSSSQANQNPMLMMAEIQGLLPQLIARDPILKINHLKVDTDQGKIDSNMQMTFDKEIYDPQNPMTMMFALDAKATGFAPIAFFQQLGMNDSIEQFVQQNMLVKDDKNVKFDFTFKEGQALLNGTPVPLGGF